MIHYYDIPIPGTAHISILQGRRLKAGEWTLIKAELFSLHVLVKHTHYCSGYFLAHFDIQVFFNENVGFILKTLKFFVLRYMFFGFLTR